jgi:leucine zipper transcription factor-like protein 1
MFSIREQELLGSLSQSSRQVLEPFFAWARQGRDRFFNDFEFESQNFKSGRLLQPTYMAHEVDALLSEHCRALHLASIKEMEHVAAGSGELFFNILLEMDRHQLPSSVNSMAVLGNRATLAVEAAATKTLKVQRSLAPITALDRGDETARQLVIATEEKRKLSEKLRQVSDQLMQVMREKSSFNAEVAQLHDQTSELQQQLSVTAQMSREQLSALLSEKDSQIRRLTGDLGAMTRDMTGKLSQSSQFQNLKAMLADRNNQVAQLRSALRRYDPVAAGMDDDIAACDDDD